MRLYSGPSRDFIDDSVHNRITDKLRTAYFNTYRREAARRTNSWGQASTITQLQPIGHRSFGARGGGWFVLLVLYLAGECCGLTLKELGEAAGGPRLTTVSKAVRRFQQQMEKDADEAARFAQAVSTLWTVEA